MAGYPLLDDDVVNSDENPERKRVEKFLASSRVTWRRAEPTTSARRLSVTAVKPRYDLPEPRP